MKALKFILKLAVRTVEVILGLLLVLGVIPQLLSVPGCRRFQRYASYGSLKEITAAETNDIWKVVPFQQDGSNFTAVVVEPCRFLASGPGVLIYDQDGRLTDRCLDIGDFCYESRRRHEDWKFWPYGPRDDAPKSESDDLK